MVIPEDEFDELLKKKRDEPPVEVIDDLDIEEDLILDEDMVMIMPEEPESDSVSVPDPGEEDE